MTLIEYFTTTTVEEVSETLSQLANEFGQVAAFAFMILFIILALLVFVLWNQYKNRKKIEMILKNQGAIYDLIKEKGDQNS